MTSADLAADTAVRADPKTPGRYHIALPNHWDYLLPSGGAVMTCALRAAEAHIADLTLRLASATTIFATPIHPGPLVADVHVIRRGGSTAQVRVVVHHAQATPPQPGLELVATFSRERKGPDVIALTVPDVRSLADSPPAEDNAPNNPHTRFRIYQQLDCRIADGDAFWQPSFAAGPPRYARWFRFKVPQRDAEGRLDRLALPPLIDTMPTALHRAIGPGPYRFYAPSLDLTMYSVDDTTREWLLVSVTLRRARAGLAIADAEVWDDEGRFIAYGTQAMYLQSLSGDPPSVDAAKRNRP
ncbi:MAG: acyl-CoA thioesterase-like protein [Myxococcales bacterium]|nr:acyl-CoA thioesterase-like protein [Myxococcales bacterium]